jgi:hypothetical protein
MSGYEQEARRLLDKTSADASAITNAVLMLAAQQEITNRIMFAARTERMNAEERLAYARRIGAEDLGWV